MSGTHQTRCPRLVLLSIDAAYESFLLWTFPSENKVGHFKFIYLFEMGYVDDFSKI